MQVYFKNKNNQFIIPVWGYVLDQKTKEFPYELPSGITSQPKFKPHDYSKDLGYRILALSTATSSLDPSRLCMTEKELMDSLNNRDLTDGLRELAKLDPVNKTQYLKFRAIQKGLRDETLTLHTFNPLLAFSQTECVALFCSQKDGTEGYIQRDGSLGTLSKALVFESQQDAQKDINRRNVFERYKDIQMVNLNMAVSSLGERIVNKKAWHSQTDFSRSSIHDVDALAQKNKIKQALEQASIEQLQEAYRALSGQEWGEEVSPSTPKKRM